MECVYDKEATVRVLAEAFIRKKFLVNSSGTTSVALQSGT
jgi:hypothetical protein